MGYITTNYKELITADNKNCCGNILDMLHNTLRDDLNALKTIVTKADKLKLAEKYGVVSCKTAEIKNAIYHELKDFRCVKTSLYNQRDFNDFYEHACLSTYKKCEETFEGEKYEFVLFVEKILQHSIETSKNIYYVQSAKREHKNVERYIKEHGSAYKIIEAKTKAIYHIIDDLMVAYKTNVFAITEKRSSKHYDMATEKMPKLKIVIDEKRAAHINPNEYYKIFLEYTHYKYFVLKYSKDEYIAREIKNTEKKLNDKIMSLSKRLVEGDFNLNLDNLKISNVSSDPKFFDMIIADDIIKLHARSIFAAEYSEKVTPHFRFIITNVK